jgi:hypothetical protein
MSFWTTSTGEQATGTVSDNNSQPLKKGWYLAMFEDFSIDEYQGERKVKIKARIIGEGYGKNRVLFMNLKAFAGEKVTDAQRDRALNIIMKSAQILGVPLPKGEPDDIWFSKFTDKPIEIMVDVWEIDDKSGNWLVNVASKGEKVGGDVAVQKTQSKKPAPPADANDDDDIPF